MKWNEEKAWTEPKEQKEQETTRLIRIVRCEEGRE